MKRFLVPFLFLTNFALQAQEGLYVEAGFVDAFNSRTIYIDKEPVANYQAYGYRLGAFYSYPVKNVDVRLGAGLKQLFFSGRYQSDDFSGMAAKLTINLQGLYNFHSNWKAGLAIEMENNRDFNHFRSQTSDLFRYNVKAIINYAVSQNVFLSLDYSRAIHPYSDFYLLTNPTDQITIGVNYKLPWL